NYFVFWLTTKGGLLFVNRYPAFGHQHFNIGFIFFGFDQKTSTQNLGYYAISVNQERLIFVGGNLEIRFPFEMNFPCEDVKIARVTDFTPGIQGNLTTVSQDN